jgi:hypothetical protein
MLPADDMPAPLSLPETSAFPSPARAAQPAVAVPPATATTAPMQPKSGAAHPASSATAPAFAAPAAPAAPQPSAATPVAVKPTGTVAQADEVDDDASPAPPGDRAVAQKMVAIARNKLKSRDAKGAADMMLRQVTTDPEDHHAMEVLVRAWIAMGRGDDAVGYAELIVKKRPRRAGYRVLEGDARLSAGDAAGAQVAWRVALQLEPDNIEAKRRLGMP